MWGTLLAVWTVAGVTVKTAKSLGISSVRCSGCQCAHAPALTHRAQVDDVKQKFERVMSPYAERCQDALEPYRDGVRACVQHACHARLRLTRPLSAQLLTGQGSLKNSEMTSRLKHMMR